MAEDAAPRERTASMPLKDSWRRSLVTASSFALVFGALVMIWMLARPLVLVLIAIVIAQALAPIVSWLERWVPRAVATILTYLVVVGAVMGGVALLFPLIADQGADLVTAAPDYFDRGRNLLTSLDPDASDQLFSAAQAGIDQFSSILVSAPMTIFNSVIDLVLVVFMSIYWLIATPQLHRFVMSLVPTRGRGRAADVLRDMGGTMGGFVRGTFIDAVIVGILAFAGFSLIGLEYAILLAVVQGLGEIIPIIGPIVAAVPAILVGLIDSFQTALVVLVFVLILQQIESNILVPLIMRNQADIPPLISLTAVAAGSTLGGMLGAIISIPIAGALQVFVVRAVAPAVRQLTGIHDEPEVIGGSGDVEEGG